MNGKDLSCDKCIITFKQTMTAGMRLSTPKIIKVNINDLYGNLTKDKCIITWIDGTGFNDKTNKFVINGNES